MEKTLNEWIKRKRELVNQLLDEGYSSYSGVSKQNPLAERLQYRHYLSQSKQGKEIIQIIKELSKKINRQYRFQLIVCDHYEDYLAKLDSSQSGYKFPI